MLPILTWISVWAATISFGLLFLVYIALMLMGDEEIREIRKETDPAMAELRAAEAEEKRLKEKNRKARSKAFRQEIADAESTRHGSEAPNSETSRSEEPEDSSRPSSSI